MPKPDDIALVNEGGHVTATKPRSAVLSTDVYHSVLVLLITPRKRLVLSMLPSKTTYERLSATATVIRRAGESPPEAAARALRLSRTLHHLGDQTYVFDDSHKTYASVFYAVGHAPESNTHVTLSAQELDERLAQSPVLTPAMRITWERYRHLLPL